MQINKQVCLPEQAKKLKELGLEVPSFLTWVELPEFLGSELMVDEQDNFADTYHDCLFFGKRICVYSPINYGMFVNGRQCTKPGLTHAAYNVAELGHMLTLVSQATGIDFVYSCKALTPTLAWYRVACDIMKPEFVEHETDDCGTEAEARADMLLWLLQNGHVQVEMLNKIYMRNES